MKMSTDEVLLGIGSRSGKANGLTLRSLEGTSPDISIASASGQGATAGDFDATTVVWTESEGLDLGVDRWTLFAYDRHSRKTTELARAPLIEGSIEPPPVPGYTGPQIMDGFTYWAQMGGAFGKETVDIFSCRIGNCVPRRVVTGAAFPSVSNGTLYYLSGSRYRGRRSGDDYAIGSFDPKSGSKSEIRKLEATTGSSPTGFDASAKYAVVTTKTEDRGRAQIIDVDNGRTEYEIDSAPEGMFTFPEITESLAIWAEGNSGGATNVGGYAVDLAHGILYSAGNTAGFYVVKAAGDLALWQETRTDDSDSEGDRISADFVVGRLPRP